jgi:hypothetical protein
MRLRHSSHLFTTTAAALALLLALLSACGGGSGGSGGSLSNATIKSVSANGAVMPSDSTEAASVALKTAQAAVATGSASTTVSFGCPGGGTVRYTVTGPVGTITNGVLDADEAYSFSFASCRSLSNAAAVTGAMTLTVNSASAATLTVSTTTSNLSVVLPQRTVTMNGSSTLTQTTSTTGTNTTTTNHWQSSSIKVTSRRGNTDSFFDLNNVNYTRNNIIAVNGDPVSSSCQGGSTLNADLAFFTWFITLATIGPVLYDATGVVIQGSWLIDLPDDRITVTINGQQVTLQVDLGRNGSIDLSLSFLLQPFIAEAG